MNGKNFGTFDKLFLELLPNWNDYIHINRRIVDPTAYYVDWKNDVTFPDLPTCKKRAGLDDNVSHHAVEDAIDVIKLIRKQYI